MTVQKEKVLEYQDLCKSYFGLNISFEEATIEANHLIRILRILKRRSV